jgi:hypothetical protein
VAISAGDSFNAQDLSTGKLTFVPAAGSGNTEPVFTFQVRDNGGTANGGVDLDPNPDTFTLTIGQSNIAPTVDLNGAAEAGVGSSAAYVENDGPALIAPDAEIGDGNDAVLGGATVTITGGFLPGDSLTVGGTTDGTTASGISFDYDPATGVLTLSGTAGLADYQAALRTIGFKHDGDAPGTGRTVSVKVNDGTADSNVANRHHRRDPGQRRGDGDDLRRNHRLQRRRKRYLHPGRGRWRYHPCRSGQ